MADPLSITASVLAVGGATLKSSIVLHGLIRGFHSQNKDARALRAEVSDLTEVLGSLLETIANNPTLDFTALELPLQRCGHACDEYRNIIERCTQHSSEDSRPSVRDWITQKYLQGDINDFRAMIAVHKSTINIALANANLRVTAISPEVLANYKDMISDTTSDLGAHLSELEDKIKRLQAGDATAIDDVAIEWHAMLEEKQSTQHGLEMCAQLSAQIVEFESSHTEHPQFSDRPSARKHVKHGLGQVGGSIQSLVTRLQSHEAGIDSQLEAMSLTDAFSEPVSTQLARLQQTKESISQCIQIVSEAKNLADERSNVFEDVTLADNSYAFSVSTVNDLVTARRLNLKGRSRHFGGQVTDETIQNAMASLTNLDLEYLKNAPQTPRDHRHDQSDPTVPSGSRQFQDSPGPHISPALKKAGYNANSTAPRSKT